MYKNGVRAFILIQPVFYFFVHLVYMSSNEDILSFSQRAKLVLLSPVYAFLQYTKLLGASSRLHKLLYDRQLDVKRPLPLVTLENCFKVQVFTEFFLQTIPQMILQVTINNQTRWDSPAQFSFAMAILLFLRDVSLITLYMIRRFIDQAEDPKIRPQTEGKVYMSRVEMDASVNISKYLLDQKEEGLDAQGNTILHQAIKNGEATSLEDIDQMIGLAPHLIYLMNREGCTPLDLAINEQQDKKATLLIDYMEKFSQNPSLRYIKKPNRLDLRFEKAFTLSVLRNNLTLIQAFPDNSIKTSYVNMSQIDIGYEEYKARKADLVRTPVHLACKMSNDEAVRQLVNEQNYDINILLHERSAISDLLSTSCYLDFNILNFLLKKRKPQINAGVRLPLNQSILRANPFIIRSLIEFGQPHPYLRDGNGKGPCHIAASKLDVDTLEALINEVGCDPMQPDNEGNTLLHQLCLGVITDAEYDFIKYCIQKYRMRLTRNSEKRSPLWILRSYN